MYRWGTSLGDLTLAGRGDLPDLESTVQFQQVMETLPPGSCVPMSVIKLGFLTDQLEIKDPGYEVEFSAEDIESQPQAQVPPQTLAAIWQLLADLTDELSDKRKRVIGAYRAATGLDRPPEQGIPPETVREVAAETYDGRPNFMQQSDVEGSVSRSDQGAATDTGDGQETRPREASSRNTSSSESRSSESETRARETTEDEPFAAGKEITTKGGERITGKNPFADPDRLKDTGLHQGGG